MNAQWERTDVMIMCVLTCWGIIMTSVLSHCAGRIASFTHYSNCMGAITNLPSARMRIHKYTTDGIGMAYHSLIDPRATSEAPEDATQGVYRLSHAIYSVVSPRQTLRELARDHASPSNSGTAHAFAYGCVSCHNAPRVCTLPSARMRSEGTVVGCFSLGLCACSVYLEGTRSHNEVRVSTPARYLLL